MGRFVQRDLVDNFNRYAGMTNNIANYVDPLGTNPINLSAVRRGEVQGGKQGDVYYDASYEFRTTDAQGNAVQAIVIQEVTTTKSIHCYVFNDVFDYYYNESRRSYYEYFKTSVTGGTTATEKSCVYWGVDTPVSVPGSPRGKLVDRHYNSLGIWDANWVASWFGHNCGFPCMGWQAWAWADETCFRTWARSSFPTNFTNYTTVIEARDGVKYGFFGQETYENLWYCGYESRLINGVRWNGKRKPSTQAELAVQTPPPGSKVLTKCDKVSAFGERTFDDPSGPPDRNDPFSKSSVGEYAEEGGE
jgi:hypothetical protein